MPPTPGPVTIPPAAGSGGSAGARGPPCFSTIFLPPAPRPAGAEGGAAGGLVATLFLPHLSRDGDPQLHVHVAIWNRVQRADGADDKWRTLDSRSLHNQRLAVAPVADRILETKLSALRYVMVPRADGNGAEIGGVGQDVKDLFSSRSVAVTGELNRLERQYEAVYGKPPSRRTLWLLHQQEIGRAH